MQQHFGKYGLVIDNDQLILTSRNKQPTYILNPKVPSIRLPKDIPANENLIPQITEQVLKLSPACDLLNTRLHVNDSDFTLQKGLFQDTNVLLLKMEMRTKANGTTLKLLD